MTEPKIVNLSIEPGQNPDVRFRNILTDLINNSINELTLLNEKSIHEARKTFKRIRSILNIYKYSIPKESFKKLNIFFRDSGRQLAELRDLQSVTECLSRYNGKNQNKLEILENAINQIKALEESKKRESNNSAIFTQIIADLYEKSEFIKKIDIDTNGYQNLFKGIWKIYSDGRNLYKISNKYQNDILMHELRKKVKFLWDISMVFKNYKKIFSLDSEDVHHLSNLLGYYHDAVLTKEFIKSSELGLSEDDKQIIFMYLKKSSKVNYLKAMKECKRIYRCQPEEFCYSIAKDYIF